MSNRPEAVWPKAHPGQSPSLCVCPEPSLTAAPDHRCPQSHATHRRRAHGLSPPPLLVPACPRLTAMVFRITHGSHCHSHVRRPPITPNAEDGFVFPSLLHHLVSIPISPLHHTLFSRRSAAAPASPPQAVPWHRATGHQVVPVRSRQSRADVIPPAVRAPHRRPRTSSCRPAQPTVP
jgi:hypothetical protein